MGKLDAACVYLSGPMEFVSDHGVEWRRKFIKLCHNADLKIDFIDPTNKPGSEESKIEEDKGYQSSLKNNKDWRKLQEYVRGYRRLDLRYVDLSDFLVAVIDPRVPQWGTSNEIYFAEMQHKPTFFVCEGGLKNLPNWLFSVIDLEDLLEGKRCNVFENIEEVVNELVLYDNGVIEMGDEWVLVRKFLEQQRRSQKPN